jgi:hypothetical protein
MRMNVRSAWAAVAIAAALSVPAARAAADPVASRPRVEVAFVLDSTGSMSGLIEGAKQKIWSIANDIISRKPTPEVRIGLLTYRDLGDEYVTRLFDLTDDIDTVFANLQSFQADGGGDTPESVNQALREAVTRMSWTKGTAVLKIVFLVGDSPPHMDYVNDVAYPAVCKEAVKRGLIIDTVQCGDNLDTMPIWQEIARLSEGSYVALAQSGNMAMVTTPFDDEISRVSGEISRTVVAYGTGERQEEARAKMANASAASASVAADRAAYNLKSGGKAIQGSGDLVSDLAQGTVDMSKLKADELPPEMRSLSPAERKAYVNKQQAARDALNAKLSKLVLSRADYLESEARKRAASRIEDSFDEKVSQIIAEQAARAK